MVKSSKKYWTVGEIDATGVRGPHEVELKNISKAKYHTFLNIDRKTLAKIVKEDLGGKFENIGFDEDWTITLEMFPEVNIHLSYTYYGKEFGDEIEAEFKFLFSGDRVFWVPGEDSATYIDIIIDFLEMKINGEKPFEKNYKTKTELLRKVLVQRNEPFKLLMERDKEKLSSFLGAKVWKTAEGWKIIRESFPEIFIEIIWDIKNGLDISFSGNQLPNNINSYHIELVGIFTINHILRYITLQYQNKDLPEICFIMFSRYFTKLNKWDHRRR